MKSLFASRLLNTTLCAMQQRPKSAGIARRAVRVGLGLMLLLAGAAGPLCAQTTLVRLVPAQISARAGQTFDLSVNIENVTGLYGVDVRLAFSPEVLEVVDADTRLEGIQVQAGQFPSPDFLVRNRVENAEGRIWYAVTQLNPNQPKNGSGTMMTIQFRARASGVTSIEVLQAQLVDNLGVELSAGFEGALITVVAEDGSTPLPPTATLTHTPAPTQAPSATPVPPATMAPASDYPYPSPPAAPATLTPPTSAPSVSTPTDAPIAPASPGYPAPEPTRPPATAAPTALPPTATPPARPLATQPAQPPLAPTAVRPTATPAPGQTIEPAATPTTAPLAALVPITPANTSEIPAERAATPAPLLPQEVLFCLFLLLVLFTLALLQYLVGQHKSRRV